VSGPNRPPQVEPPRYPRRNRSFPRACGALHSRLWQGSDASRRPAHRLQNRERGRRCWLQCRERRRRQPPRV